MCWWHAEGSDLQNEPGAESEQGRFPGSAEPVEARDQVLESEAELAAERLSGTTFNSILDGAFYVDVGQVLLQHPQRTRTNSKLTFLRQIVRGK